MKYLLGFFQRCPGLPNSSVLSKGWERCEGQPWHRISNDGMAREQIEAVASGPWLPHKDQKVCGGFQAQMSKGSLKNISKEIIRNLKNIQ